MSFEKKTNQLGKTVQESNQACEYSRELAHCH